VGDGQTSALAPREASKWEAPTAFYGSERVNLAGNMCYSGKCDGLFFAHAVLPSSYSERFTVYSVERAGPLRQSSAARTPITDSDSSSLPIQLR
jgi:hypothetical protein